MAYYKYSAFLTASNYELFDQLMSPEPPRRIQVPTGVKAADKRTRAIIPPRYRRRTIINTAQHKVRSDGGS